MRSNCVTSFLLQLHCLSLLLFLVHADDEPNKRKEKRQLFREHLLPSLGGKIPDSTFIPERITLNRLNQNGFYTPNGIILEQRHPDRSHNVKAYPPQTIKIVLPPDNKYVAAPGRSYSPQTIDTSYIIREPLAPGYTIAPQLLYYHDLPVPPHLSLELLQRFQYFKRPGNIQKSVYDLYPAEPQIFKEFEPQLKRLHSYD